MTSNFFTQASADWETDADQEDGTANAKDEVVNSLMLEWEPRYCNYQNLKVFCGTYNINGQLPQKFESFAPWLTDTMTEPPDIYAIGFQELDLAALTLLGRQSSPREEDFVNLCAKGLHPGAQYVEVVRERLSQILLVIYVKKSVYHRPSTSGSGDSSGKKSGLLMSNFFKPNSSSGGGKRSRGDTYDITNFRVGVVETGLWNKFGNKGGVCCSMDILDTSVSFLCCHLAAGNEDLHKRNSDYRDICRKMILRRILPTTMATAAASGMMTGGVGSSASTLFTGSPAAAGGTFKSSASSASLSSSNSSAASSHHHSSIKSSSLNYHPNNNVHPSFGSIPSAGPATILEHDAVFWLGDLNYRLENLNSDEVRHLCDQSAYEKLLLLDQLNRQKEKRIVFDEFEEGSIRFPPTYKYDVGTDVWDSSEKARAPAWCDRVLYSQNGAKIDVLDYGSVPVMKVSDHKPVYALLNLRAKEVDQDKRAKWYIDALKEGDRRANDALPQVKLDKTDFDFGEVKFLDIKTDRLMIRNTGLYPLVMRFKTVPKADRVVPEAICESWLIVQPEKQRVQPNEEKHVDLQVCVDKQTAWRLNKANSAAISDMLVLHLRYGRDYFLTISATYVPSVFGKSLIQTFEESPKAEPKQDLLIDLTPDTKTEAEKQREDDQRSAMGFGVPMPLWRLVNHIEMYGLTTGDLFGQCSSQKEFAEIRDALDRGEPLRQSIDVHGVVEALLRLLDSLPEPVILRTCTDQCLKMGEPNLEPYNSWTAVNRTLSQQPAADPHRVHLNTFKFLVGFFRKVSALSDDNGATSDQISAIFATQIFGITPLGMANSKQEVDEVKRQLRLAERFLINCIETEEPVVSRNAEQQIGKSNFF